MLKHIMLASLAASALALNAPAAFADPSTHTCRFRSVQQDDVTGQNYEGVAEGVVVDADGETVTIQCYVKVNSAEASATPVGSGTKVAATAGRVTFQAADSDNVELCARGTDDSGSYDDCVGTTHIQIPPQEVIDLLDKLQRENTDPLICPQLVAHAGTYGPVTIEDDGDVWVDGDGREFDCDPYGD